MRNVVTLGSVVSVMDDLVVLRLSTPSLVLRLGTPSVVLLGLLTPSVVLGSLVLGPFKLSGLSGSNESGKSEGFHCFKSCFNLYSNLLPNLYNAILTANRRFFIPNSLLNGPLKS